MEKESFELLRSIERSWWYRGRAGAIRAVLGRVGQKGMMVLDYGAGFGGMCAELAPYGQVFAFETDPRAYASARQRGYLELYNDVESALGQSYDLIALFDVLEHLPDDRASLIQMRESFSKSGKIILTVPAMPFLWSVHDTSHHHFRRYTHSSLRRVLEEAGYTVEYMSYWNMLLFVPAALVRLFGSAGDGSLRLSPIVDALLYRIIRVEVFLMRFIRLPIGISLVALVHTKNM
ncbi:class I SAM-dependent methyltransferase [Candidatus Kaiserbacteria bacterium]|nr:class I SAM-dependent methyltransferase [Candidatus Kaiserbacteria bacterium]